MTGEYRDGAESVAPAPPPVVLKRFPGGAAALQRYGDWLAGPGTTRGLMGPRETPRLWERHILNCVAVAELFPVGARIVDIGTGAGLPGIPLACVRPDLRIDLVESLDRRIHFLTEVVEDLGLEDRVRVIRGRAEDAGVVETVGSSLFVTARAVAPLDRLVRWAFPLLSRGGRLLALKGSTVEDEIEEHDLYLRRMHAEVVGVHECGQGLVEELTRVVEIVRR